ncbi:hypothetical protein ZHAS_00004587 [Anopheles sinensis]|uniref:Uncharacterized protein n=1 Tax=Anopheles sinensis TaxID=74873 RepID=A0A084VHK7_ANOSI|nr:hypothetical protein ZHAS_00004587 [Anopheles sinensis]
MQLEFSAERTRCVLLSTEPATYALLRLLLLTQVAIEAQRNVIPSGNGQSDSSAVELLISR